MTERKPAKSGRNGVGKRAFRKDDAPRKSYRRKSTDGDSRDDDRPKRRFNDSDRPKRRFNDEDRPKRRFNDDDRPKRRFNDDDRPKRRFNDDDRPKRRFNDDDRPKRRFNDDDRPKRRFNDDDRPKRRFNDDDRPKRRFNDDDRPKRRFNDDDRPKRRFNDDDRPKRRFNDDDRPKRRFNDDDRPKRRFNDDDRPKRRFNDDDRPKRRFNDDDRPKRRFNDDDRPRRSFNRDSDFRGKRRFDNDENSEETPRYNYIKSSEPEDSRVRRTRLSEKRAQKQQEQSASNSSEMRLNKFIANSGVCSRREADTYIEAGVVSVNGTVVTELGSKILPTDEIRFNGELLHGEKKVYLLMNKPKGYVTTVEDPHADKTVMDIAGNYCSERIYPVGRLDKNTTGVLLFTNDGDLTKQLTHPSYEKKKIYSVGLDKNLTKTDMQRLADGVELEDGLAFADVIAYEKEDDKKKIGVEIHSGRNRIIRRMFEFMDYKVTKLDRVYFAGLTKSKLRRGECRFLSEKEIAMLKSGQYE